MESPLPGAAPIAPGIPLRLPSDSPFSFAALFTRSAHVFRSVALRHSRTHPTSQRSQQPSRPNPQPCAPEPSNPHDSVALSYVSCFLRKPSHYEINAAQVQLSVLALFKDHLFHNSTSPSDVLGFALAFAVLATIAIEIRLLDVFPAEQLHTVKAAAHLAHLPSDDLSNYVESVSEDDGSLDPLRAALSLFLAPFKSSLLSELVWPCALQIICPGKADSISFPPVEFLSQLNSFAILATGSSPQALSLTHDGHIIHEDSLFLLAGYSKQGVLLSPLPELPDRDPKPELDTPFESCIQVIPAYRPLPSELCAGSSCALRRENDALTRYVNPAISADLSTVRSVTVADDGSASFDAQTLVFNDHGVLLRTSYETLTASVFLLHALIGFEVISKPDSEPKLSFLFDGGPRGLSKVFTTGVKVVHVLNHVDSYEIDDQGRVFSITLNGERKCACSNGFYSFRSDHADWSTDAEEKTSFLVDTVVS